MTLGLSLNVYNFLNGQPVSYVKEDSGFRTGLGANSPLGSAQGAIRF
jgi:hypothetical protein